MMYRPPRLIWLYPSGEENLDQSGRASTVRRASPVVEVWRFAILVLVLISAAIVRSAIATHLALVGTWGPRVLGMIHVRVVGKPEAIPPTAL